MTTARRSRRLSRSAHRRTKVADMRPRTPAVIAAIVTAVALTGPSIPTSTANAASRQPLAPVPAGGTLADRVDVPARTGQLVTVTSRGWDATHAWLRVWRRTPEGWVEVRERIRVRLGYGGWVAARQRVQSTGTTP